MEVFVATFATLAIKRESRVQKGITRHQLLSQRTGWVLRRLRLNLLGRRSEMERMDIITRICTTGTLRIKLVRWVWG